MRAACAAGITFLDDARYDDETGTAPIRTGYSEVRFGELFRAAGRPRGETVVANKLWWEFWPEQDAAAELDASLHRMQLDYVDVIYANPPVNGITIATMVDEVAGLVASGRARRVGDRQLAGRPAARPLAGGDTRRRPATLCRAAAVQPRATGVGRGRGDEAGTRRLRRARGRVVRPRGRRAHGQVRDRPERGPRRGAARRPALRGRGRLRPAAGGPRARARLDTRRARDRVRAPQPQRRERALRRDESRPAPPERGRARGRRRASTTSSGHDCWPSARHPPPGNVPRSRTTTPTPRNHSTSSSPTGYPGTSASSSTGATPKVSTATSTSPSR